MALIILQLLNYNKMKKIFITIAIATSLIACKKETKSNPKDVKYYIKVVAVDNDDITQTETPYKTITKTQ